MDQVMVWDGHNLVMVVFLIVLVVALSCGLLGFICMRIIEDFYNDGLKPMFVLTRRIASNDLSMPTKIIVTKPQEGSLASVTEDSRNDESRLSGKKRKKRSKIRPPSSHFSDSPGEEIIFSCDSSPGSPCTSPPEKVYHWSKSNNYDYTGNTTKINNNKKTNLNNMNHNQARVEINSPLSLYSNTISNRCYSAPSRPHVNRTDTILYM